MPESPLPARPDFDFFAAPDVTTDRDAGDEAAPLVYPTRAETVTRVHAGDFETDEIARLTRERDAAIREYEACHDIMDTVRVTIAACLGDEINFGLTVEAARKAVAEIERQRTQRAAARLAYHAAYQALVTDNPWRMAEVRDALRAIGAALGVE